TGAAERGRIRGSGKEHRAGGFGDDGTTVLNAHHRSELESQHAAADGGTTRCCTQRLTENQPEQQAESAASCANGRGRSWLDDEGDAEPGSTGHRSLDRVAHGASELELVRRLVERALGNLSELR